MNTDTLHIPEGVTVAGSLDSRDSGSLSGASVSDAPYNNAPIGVFDSGFGGLTVAYEIAKALPDESIVYLGDSQRCPYGPRDLSEVDSFVQQIGSWLVDCGVKMVVIACNTATAAGLAHAQKTFPVPVIGVVEPGARAAVHATRNRRVGVIATKGTVESAAYSKAIRSLDAGVTVFSTPTPRFVEIAEQGIRMAEGPIENYTSLASKAYIRPAFQEIAKEYLEPLRRCGIDTLVLGCTHFPLLKALIGGVVGRNVTLISSAKETARDVAEILGRRSARAQEGHKASYSFFTTGSDTEEFSSFGSRVFRSPIGQVRQVALDELVKGTKTMKQVVLATNNAHKVDEIANALDFLGWEFVTLRQKGVKSDPEENGSTFEENARIKARAAHEACGGSAAMADDSGLVVDALDGAPGVHSARYAGEDATDEQRMAKLLSELEGVPEDRRTARFVCSLVFVDEDGSETVATGTVEGKIAFEPRGSQGFGYDPVFIPDELGGELTFAQVEQARKSGISHRGNALRRMKDLFEAK